MYNPDLILAYISLSSLSALCPYLKGHSAVKKLLCFYPQMFLSPDLKGHSAVKNYYVFIPRCWE